MNPEKFDMLKTTSAGEPIVTLMAEPSMAQGAETGFLSLVARGANGRRLQVLKSAEVCPACGGMIGENGKCSKCGLARKDCGACASKNTSGACEKCEEKVRKMMCPSCAQKMERKGDKMACKCGYSRAAKAEEMVEGERPITTDYGLGVREDPAPWWRTLFGSFFRNASTDPSSVAGGEVAKADPAAVFEASVLIPTVWDAYYKGGDALRNGIDAVLKDETITDKVGAIEQMVEQFKRFMLNSISASPVLKTEQAIEVAKAARSVDSRSFAGMITATDRATIVHAQAVLKSATEALGRLAEGQTPKEPAKKADQESDPMASINQAEALHAAQVAVLAAKAANPALTAADAQRIAVEVVTKMAVGGPAQPAIPTTLLADQIAQSGGEGGKMSDPLGDVRAALASMKETTQKTADAVAALGLRLEGNGKDDPGLVGVVQKLAESNKAIASKVAKFETTPTAPRGSEPTPQVAKKSDDDTFKGTAFSIGA